MKTCGRCHIPQPVDNFSRDRNRPDRLDPYCKACRALARKPIAKKEYAEQKSILSQKLAAHRLKTRTENPEDYLAKKHARWQRHYAKHREKILKRNAAYATAHPEAVNQKSSRYAKSHPEQMQINNATRRARINNAPLVEPINLEVLALRDGWTCHVCKRRVTRTTWSHDHLIPLSQGGDHTYLNIALCHRRCNSKRGSGRIPAQLRLLP